MYDLILEGALVYDGLGNPPRYIDIGIKGERIAKVGDLIKVSCQKRIKLSGLSVSPGFIDIHSHSDVYYFLDPQAQCKIRQGVTTEVIGNCGSSAAPLYGEFKAARKKEWKPLGIRIRWGSFREYIDLLRDSGIAVNVVPLVGHGNIRGAVKGYSTSAITKRDMGKMQKLLNNAMEEGAMGLSSGLIYTPGMYTDTRELIELVKIAARFKSIYTSHIRGEGDTLLDAIKEAIIIASDTGVKVEISHLKTSGKRNWPKLREAFNVIEDAISHGIDITCDRYPYIASNTDLDTLLPDWFHKMKYIERKDWINNRQDELIDVLKNILKDDWQERVMIGRVKNRKNRWAEGLFISEVSKRLKLGSERIVLELLKGVDFQVQAIFFNMCEKNLIKILKKPYVMIGSDSSLRTMKGILKMGHPHPRTFGTFPRVLARYTGKGRLSMKEAIHKMTGMPARKLALKGRGRISEGAYADIVIFNSKKIKDKATYEKPYQYPEGIEFVIVNGEIVLDKGVRTSKLPGKVLLNV